MITTEQQLKDTVDKVAVIQLNLQQLLDQRDSSIQNRREYWSTQIEPLQNEIKALSAEAGKYAKANRKALLGGARSTETTQAFWGFRMGLPTLRKLAKFTWEKVLANAKRAGLPEFIETIEKLDKDKIKAEATPEELEALGCKIGQTERFFIKPKDPGASKAQKVA